MANYPQFLVIDCFCGAGGTTQGMQMAKDGKYNLAKVIAAINHDEKAIISHKRNHKKVLHITEDMRTADLTDLVRITKFYREKFPQAKLILWFSLECTNFSNAKGGKPRDADSRTLADHCDRYIIALQPDFIQIENVVEFLAWGPLDKNGKPLSRKNGKDFIRWRQHIEGLGYTSDYREINSADLGAYTSRNRLFILFAKHGEVISWPAATHSKNPDLGLFGGLKKWKAVKDVLDLHDHGNSIFGRKKELVPRTLERIYAGLVKFVANGDESFITKFFSGQPAGMNISVDMPAGTLTTRCNQGVVHAVSILKYNSMNKNGKYNAPGVEDPCPTIACQNRLGVVFMQKYFGTGVAVSLENPCGTIKTKLHLSTVATVPVQYLFNPQYFNKGRSVDSPAFTLIARMDKAPPYLVTTSTGEVSILIYKTDCEWTVKIKLLMAAYGIADVKMRMLNIKELLRIQGFSDKYYLEGTQADKKKFIGNAVHPLVPKAWCESLHRAIKEMKYSYQQIS